MPSGNAKHAREFAPGTDMKECNPVMMSYVQREWSLRRSDLHRSASSALEGLNAADEFAKVHDEGATALTGCDDPSIIGLGAEDPIARPLREIDQQIARLEAEDLDALVVTAADDSTVRAIEMQGANEVPMAVELS